MRRVLASIAIAVGVIVPTVAGPESPAQATGDTFVCEAGLPAISVRIPYTTRYLTFGPGLSRLTSQAVSPPQDPYAPGVYLQIAEAYAKPDHHIVETITKWVGPPTWDYWNGGQDYVHMTFALANEHGPLVDYVVNCVA